MINQVVIEGRLAQDAVIRQSASGLTFANFTLSSTDSRRQDSGEWAERVEWIDVKLIGKLAERHQEHLLKGRHLVVHGKLQTEKWTNKEGVPCQKVRVVGWAVFYHDQAAR